MLYSELLKLQRIINGVVNLIDDAATDGIQADGIYMVRNHIASMQLPNNRPLPMQIELDIARGNMTGSILNKILAIKIYRERTGCTLREAKEMIDKHI